MSSTGGNGDSLGDCDLFEGDQNLSVQSLSAEEPEVPLDTDDLSEIDESECISRKIQCLKSLACLKHQFSVLREQLNHENNVKLHLAKVSGGQSSEELGSLQRLQPNIDKQDQAAETFKLRRNENSKHSSDIEELYTQQQDDHMHVMETSKLFAKYTSLQMNDITSTSIINSKNDIIERDKTEINDIYNIDTQLPYSTNEEENYDNPVRSNSPALEHIPPDISIHTMDTQITEHMYNDMHDNNQSSSESEASIEDSQPLYKDYQFIVTPRNNPHSKSNTVSEITSVSISNDTFHDIYNENKKIGNDCKKINKCIHFDKADKCNSAIKYNHNFISKINHDNIYTDVKRCDTIQDLKLNCINEQDECCDPKDNLHSIKPLKTIAINQLNEICKSYFDITEEILPSLQSIDSNGFQDLSDSRNQVLNTSNAGTIMTTPQKKVWLSKNITNSNIVYELDLDETFKEKSPILCRKRIPLNENNESTVGNNNMSPKYPLQSITIYEKIDNLYNTQITNNNISSVFDFTIPQTVPILNNKVTISEETLLDDSMPQASNFIIVDSDNEEISMTCSPILDSSHSSIKRIFGKDSDDSIIKTLDPAKVSDITRKFDDTHDKSFKNTSALGATECHELDNIHNVENIDENKWSSLKPKQTINCDIKYNNSQLINSINEEILHINETESINSTHCSSKLIIEDNKVDCFCEISTTLNSNSKKSVEMDTTESIETTTPRLKKHTEAKKEIRQKQLKTPKVPKTDLIIELDENVYESSKTKKIKDEISNSYINKENKTVNSNTIDEKNIEYEQTTCSNSLNKCKIMKRGSKCIRKYFNVTNSNTLDTNETHRCSKRLKMNDLKVEIANNSRNNKCDNSVNSVGNNSSLSSLKDNHHILFTAYPKYAELSPQLEKLGAVIATDVMTCTVLVTEEIKRTFKMLCAVGRGIPVVGVNWVTACLETNMIIDPWLHIIENDPMEQKYNFNLRATLTGQRNYLKGYNVSSTPSVRPKASELKLIVECSGGVWKEGGEKWLCISTHLDTVLWPMYKRRGAIIAHQELILEGVLQQRFDKDYVLMQKVE